MYKYLANTVFTGKKILHLPSCHSTNTKAREMAQKDECIEGTIIITDNQIAGKGQRGNTWESAPGENLTFSLIYKPVFLQAQESFYLNIITSLALVQGLKDFGIPARIKWPNDIYNGNRKISGILIENSIEANHLKHSIIGIGLNVNQVEFSLPDATSMYIISNRLYKIPDVLDAVASYIEQFYLKLKSGKRYMLRDDYHRMLLGMRESREFMINGERVFGVIEGVEESGRLKVEIAGKTEFFSFKEIKFLF